MIPKCFALLACFLLAMASDDKYDDKYDNIDIQEILGNRRLLIGYMNCINDKGICSPEGKTLKQNLQEAIETGCEKCTDQQVNKTTEIFKHLIKNELEIWNELSAKFDPKGIWRKKYAELFKTRGVVFPEN